MIQRTTYAAHRARSRSHSTTATPGVSTKCEKYTQLAATSHQWMPPGSYRCSWSHSVGTWSSVSQPNMPRSAATISMACGMTPWSAKPRDRLYNCSSSTTATQSRANSRWRRRGRSMRQATVAAHSHRNVRIGSVNGRPSRNHQAVNPTAQADIAITRRRRLGTAGAADGSSGAGASGRIVSVIAHKAKWRPHRPLHEHRHAAERDQANP
jgi:hypothetical protein